MKVVKGTVDGNKFLDFIQKDLLPGLMPFDGINHNSIVILDNLYSASCVWHGIDDYQYGGISALFATIFSRLKLRVFQR